MDPYGQEYVLTHATSSNDAHSHLLSCLLNELQRSPFYFRHQRILPVHHLDDIRLNESRSRRLAYNTFTSFQVSQISQLPSDFLTTYTSPFRFRAFLSGSFPTFRALFKPHCICSYIILVHIRYNRYVNLCASLNI